MLVKISDRFWIVGTSHIARQSHKEIKDAFDELDPDVVALELDRQRLHALLSGAESRPTIGIVRQVGVTGYLFLKVGAYVQRKLGSVVHVKPGSEMKVAYSLAAEHGRKVLLADRPIQMTMRRLSSVKGWRLRLLWDMVSGPFRKKQLDFDIRGVPSEEVLVKIMGFFRERYPVLYNVLVAERDAHLAGVVKAYHQQHPDGKVLLVVGAGHVKGVSDIVRRSVESKKS